MAGNLQMMKSHLDVQNSMPSIKNRRTKSHEAHHPHAADHNLHSRLAGVDTGRRVPDWYGVAAGGYGDWVCGVADEILFDVEMEV